MGRLKDALAFRILNGLPNEHLANPAIHSALPLGRIVADPPNEGRPSRVGATGEGWA
jgi:hypothetical protein